ncbi:hypothetical protein HM1_0811 [Heliomicrobium modesticaldum Ice1]|uniref:Uncharacterized protein n=1 Tax=Heliobacterium modesticaldum (strain ATCC 51547 / Ice1) TaxID=498761 RepID=B0TB18_HELMI|nr:hypothetical protein [Heliomicrobium modesticaldum]ABZ83745.1 hypothetical protein HM1_0811 [Heliomicrobium modesticaldum Ice1]
MSSREGVKNVPDAKNPELELKEGLNPDDFEETPNTARVRTEMIVGEKGEERTPS